MNSPRHVRLDIVALVVLGLIAAVVSGAALMRSRSNGSVTATPRPVTSASHAPTAEVPPATTPSDEPSVEPSVSSPAAGALKVVIIGDSYSIGDPAGTWVGPATQQLNWGSVTNLSAPGRGFIATPRDCSAGVPCTPFGGAVDAIAADKPDLVITFGGIADGDFSITEQSKGYFTALRAALPDTQLVALSTVTTETQVPYWVTLHGESLRAAVDSAGGVYVDLGQPALGDGTTLSAQAQAAIAQSVVGKLG